MDSDLTQRINITGDKTVYSQSIRDKISSEVGKIKSIEIESVNLHVKVNNHSKKEVYEIETSVVLKKGGGVFAKTVGREPNLVLNENLKDIQKELMKKKKNPMHDHEKIEGED